MHILNTKEAFAKQSYIPDENLHRFNLGSIERPKKSGFGPYATPPKRLSIFEITVRDQEVGGSNPLAPTILFKNLDSTFQHSLCLA